MILYFEKMPRKQETVNFSSGKKNTTVYGDVWFFFGHFVHGWGYPHDLLLGKETFYH
jgi:hypothetical protein